MMNDVTGSSSQNDLVVPGISKHDVAASAQDVSYIVIDMIMVDTSDVSDLLLADSALTILVGHSLVVV